VAGFGQALLESELEDPRRLPYVLARNEQGMVHAAGAFARQRNRLFPGQREHRCARVRGFA
jgi:3D-(3,5/4)-trihydroxycyclohexane-1,2-dione acylhydrolase (decyclizing)